VYDGYDGYGSETDELYIRDLNNNGAWGFKVKNNEASGFTEKTSIIKCTQGSNNLEDITLRYSQLADGAQAS